MEDDYERFVGERADALLRFAYVLTGNPHDAADLVQEALVRLRGAWPRVRRKTHPEAYVRTTMTRLHVNTWRLRRREHLAWDLPERQGGRAHPHAGGGQVRAPIESRLSGVDARRLIVALKGDLQTIVDLTAIK